MRSILTRWTVFGNLVFWLLGTLVAVTYLALVVNELRSGLEYDESFLLSVVKNVANGHGYLSDGVSFSSRNEPFDPNISTGPTMLIPAAVVWKFSSGNLAAMRLVPVAFFGLYLGALWLIFRRWGDRWIVLVAVAAPLLIRAGIPDLTTRSLVPGRFVGEIAAVGLLVLGSYLLQRDIPLLGGIAFGLSMTSKLNFGLAVVSVVAIFFLAAWMQRALSWSMIWKVACGVFIPLAAFEVYRFASLGFGAYIHNWGYQLLWLRAQTADADSIAQSLAPRVASFFSLVTLGGGILLLWSLALLVVGVLQVGGIARPFAAREWRHAAAVLGLSAGSFVSLLWWLLRSYQNSPRQGLPSLLIFLPILAVASFDETRELTQRNDGRRRVIAVAALTVFSVIGIVAVAMQFSTLMSADHGVTLAREQVGASNAILDSGTPSIPAGRFWTYPEFLYLTGLPSESLAGSRPATIQIFTSTQALAELGDPNAERFLEQCGAVLWRSQNVLVCR